MMLYIAVETCKPIVFVLYKSTVVLHQCCKTEEVGHVITCHYALHKLGAVDCSNQIQNTKAASMYGLVMSTKDLVLRILKTSV